VSTTVLATWAAGLTWEKIPGHVRRATARHLLDGVGNAVAARRHGVATAAWTVAHGLGGPPEARVLTGHSRISAPAAALGTGVLVHALDFDDTHGTALVHATAVVLPAAFAVGQQVSATGAQVLTAAAAGLEVACRLGAAAPYGFHARGVHATGAVGPLAAALTAGCLSGMAPSSLMNALGIAGSAAGGLLEFLDTGSDTKTLHPGLAGMNGLTATRLAGAGASGPHSVLEGRRGLYAALTDRAPDMESVTADLGERWEADRIGIKPYPNCQLMHVALDALTDAFEGRWPEPESVSQIEVQLHPDGIPIVCGPRTGLAAPLSSYKAKFDLPWSLAALTYDRAVTVDTYTRASIERSPLAKLASRVVVRPAHSRRPAADAPGRVVVRLTDGSELIGAADSSRGTAANPLTDDQLRDKFLHNCGHHEAAAELANSILNLDQADSLTPLLDGAERVAGQERT